MYLYWKSLSFEGSEAVELSEERGSRLEHYWTEFNTNRGGVGAALKRFLKRPMVSLLGETEKADYVAHLRIGGVADHWHVVTTIHNHHLGLNPRITRVIATVSNEDETVYLDVHKVPGDEEEPPAEAH